MRLAEKIRNTQPWCVALLKAPVVELGDCGPNFAVESRLSAVPDTKLYMPWTPGFVVHFSSVYERDAILSGVREDLVVAVRQGCGGAVSVEVFSQGALGCYFVMAWVLEVGESVSELKAHPEKTYEQILSDTHRDMAAFCSSRRVPPPRRRITDAFCIKRGIDAVRLLGHALGLLNCKNVHLEERKNPPKRRSKGRDKRQVDSYWVLNVPGSPRYWERQAGAEAGIKSRLHVVRGHFKHYTESAPLFGRIVGTVWVPCHARGNADLGLIEKDYSMAETPQ